MALSDNGVKGVFRRDYSWIECVLHIDNESKTDLDQLVKLNQEFGRLTVLSQKNRPEKLESSVRWEVYDIEDRSKAEKWNELLDSADCEWVLFLDADEKLSFYTLPQMSSLSREYMVRANITRKDEKASKTFCQIRMVHSSAQSPFEGKFMPDCTSYIVENDMGLYEHPIIINRTNSLTGAVRAETELAVRKITPAGYLLQAEQLMEDKKYVQAAAQYRNILKIKRLLPFDRLAAVNGLTRCYTEQYKWTKALSLAKQSLDAEPVQRLPYLIQYRIHELNKQWGKAYESLKAYYDYLSEPGRASYDRGIDEKETLEQLGDLAAKAGNKHGAFNHLEEIYSGKRPDSRGDKHLLRKLLIFSIEIGKRERAVYYFKEMFEANLPDALTDRQKLELDDYMELFMTNKWYAFVGEVYEQMYEADPGNAEYRRRLIVALSKTDRIERARKLIAI